MLMKRTYLFLLLLLILSLSGCTSAVLPEETQSENASSAQHTGEDKNSESISENDRRTERILYIKIGSTVLKAELADNTSAKALWDCLEKSDITIRMSDYGGFEKVGALGFSLPTNDEQITTETGDLILYQGDQFVIYYDKNSWTFTRLGKIKGLSQETLKSILGDGDVTVVLTTQREPDK